MMLPKNIFTAITHSLIIFAFFIPANAGVIPSILYRRNLDIPNSVSLSFNSTSQTNASIVLNFPNAPPLPSVENQTSSSVVESTSEYFDSDTWTLYTNELRNNSFAIQPYSANGYIGARIPVQGHGLAFDKNNTDPKGPAPINGWPLFDPRFTGSYVAGFWNYQRNITATNFPELLKKGGESVISTLPVWTTLDVTDLNSSSTYNTDTNNSQISNWSQSVSLKNGIVQTNLTWSPTPNNSYQLNYTIVTHRNRPNLGIVRLDITSSNKSQINITDILDGAGSLRTKFVDSDLAFEPAIWTAVQPIGIRNVTAYEYSTVTFSNNTSVSANNREGSSLASHNDSTISQQFTLSLKANDTVTIIKYVGIASSDAFPSDPFIAARTASIQAVNVGWNSLLKEHNTAWNDIWNQADIQIPGDTELQVSARATLFHLIANVREGDEGEGLGDNSISVGGLSSDSYAGFIFWDADTWMSPGLQALFPNFASSITNYRAKLENQAILNAQSQNYPGAVFPWTSSRFGNCTSTGPCFDYEYHINADVVQAQWQYFLGTNDTEWLNQTGWPIIRNAAEFFAAYAIKNGSTNGQYYTYNLTDPDEYANHVNNGAYTNAAISKVMQWAIEASQIVGAKANPKWLDISQNIHIPQNSSLDLTLEYDGMNGTAAIKQADVVMLTYPLGYGNQSDVRGIRNLQFYADKQSPDGPAMTYAIFAIDTAELSTQGCSTYTYLLYSSQPYLRRPFYQFSEQLIDNPNLNGGTNPAFPFLTGHGGYLQVYTHGLTGYRPMYDSLYLDPSLPPQLKDGVFLKGLKFQGGVFDVNITLTNSIITRRPDWSFSLSGESLEAEKEISIQIGPRNPKAGNYTLHVNQTLSVPTFRPDLNSTVFPGNVAQCKPVDSQSPWVAGRFPVSINDGDNSTVWQPLSDEKTVITIDLGEERSFSSAYFLWGVSPPKTVSLGVVGIITGNVTVASNSTFSNSTFSNSTSSNNTTSTQWIVNDQTIDISKPFNIQDVNSTDIIFPYGNDSVINLQKSYNSRFVQIAIEGSHDTSGNGGTIAEIVLS